MINKEYNIVAHTVLNRVKIYFIYLYKALRGTLHNEVQIIKEAALDIAKENSDLRRKLNKSSKTVSVSKKPSKKKDSGSK